MRILVTAAPGLGHVLPLLPLARAARERGHAVHFATGAALATVVRAAGFDHTAAGPASLADVAAGIPELADLTGRRRAVTMVRHGFCDRIARGMAADIEEAIEARRIPRPDLIIHEDMELGSWLVAERLGVPHATVQVTAWRPPVRRLMAEAVDPVRAEHDLPTDATDRLLGDVFFTTRPRSMRDASEPMPGGTRELRPIADDEAAREGEPVAVDRPAGAGPRIAVTLGTVNAGQHGLLRAIVDGAAALPESEVIVGLGSDPAAFGAIPSNVRAHRYIPMSALLPTVDAVAFHGGSGTLTAALAAARPMVIVPLAADQLDNADRAAAAGVARVVQAEDVSPDAIRLALEDVLREGAFARRAEAVAAEIAAMPGPDVAIQHLETIASTGGTA